MEHPKLLALREFYVAFQRCHAAARAALFAPDATVSDPAFLGRKGAEVPAMWASLCGAATRWKVELVSASASDGEGAAHWETWYSFGLGKRPAHTGDPGPVPVP